MVEARRGRGAKKAQQWTEGNKTDAKKINRNYKKNPKNTEIDIKVIQQNTKTNIETEEVGKRKRDGGHQV
jgi:hypothetical protein